MTQHEQPMKHLEHDILRVRRETELIERETEQLRQDLPRLDWGSIAALYSSANEIGTSKARQISAANWNLKSTRLISSSARRPPSWLALL